MTASTDDQEPARDPLTVDMFTSTGDVAVVVPDAVEAPPPQNETLFGGSLPVRSTADFFAGGSGTLEDDSQLSLIDLDEDWQKEWQGMPEFVQNDLEPYKTIYVHFEKREDMEAFAQLIDQRIAFETKFVWFPKAEIDCWGKRCYIDSHEGEA